MNAVQLMKILRDFCGDAPVVVFKDDEQFEIKGVCIERADGENESAVVIQI